MLYQVNLKDILLVVNPLQAALEQWVTQELQSSLQPVDMARVRQQLKQIHQGQAMGNDEQAIAAYVASFPADKAISFIDEAGAMKVADKESFYLLMAALYRREDTLLIEIENLAAFFDPALIKPVEQPSHALSMDSDFDWSVDFRSKWQNWQDKSFVLSYLKSVDNVDEKASWSMIDQQLFEDEDFLKQLCGIGNFINLVIANGLKTPEQLLALVQDNPHNTLYLWEKYFEGNYLFAVKSRDDLISNEKQGMKRTLDQQWESYLEQRCEDYWDEIQQYLDKTINDKVLGYPDDEKLPPYWKKATRHLRGGLMDEESLPGSFHNEDDDYWEQEHRSLKRARKPLYPCDDFNQPYRSPGDIMNDGVLVAKWRSQWEALYAKPEQVNTFLQEQIDTVLQRHSQLQEIKKLCNKHVFSNVAACTELISKKSNAYKFLEYVSQEVKNDAGFQDALFSKRKLSFDGGNFLCLLPEGYFNMPDGTAHQMKRAQLMYAALNRPREYQFISRYKWVQQGLSQELQNYISMRYQIEEHSSNFKPDVENFYQMVVPATQRHDKALVCTLLEINPELFSRLSTTLKEDEEIAQQYLNLNGSPAKVATSLVFKQTDKSIIMRAVRENPQLLNDPDVPKQWRTTAELVAPAIQEGTQLNLSAQEVKLLFANEEQTIALVRKYNKVYSLLPEALQENVNIAITYLASVSQKTKVTDLINEVPAILWNMDHFCMRALKIRPDFAIKIPSFHWSNKRFLHEMFTHIDQGDIQDKLFLYAPNMLKDFVDSFSVKDNYAQFFKTYVFQDNLSKTIKPAGTKVARKKI